MKHKLWLILLVFMSALCLTFGLSACGGTGQGGTEKPVDPETFVSEQITAEEWEAAFTDENFVNYKAEWSVRGSGEFSTETTSGKTTITGTVIVMRESDKTYMKREATATFESGEQETETEERYTERDQNSDWAFYVYEKEEGEWDRSHGSFWKVGDPYNGANYILYCLQNSNTLYDIICLPFMDGKANYDQEKQGYVYETEGEGSHESYLFKFKKGKLATILVNLNGIYSEINSTAECSIIYGGQKISLPEIEEKLEYRLNEDQMSYSVVGIGTWRGSDLTIPAEYNGKPVTSIGDYASNGCSGLTSVTIPDSVTSIGVGAFYGCNGLESIVVAEGNSVYHSKNNCLIKTDSHTLIVGCKNSILPDDGSVTSIGDGAFWFCERLESIEIPDSVTSIGRNAFYGCSGLTSVTIGSGVTSIGASVFHSCSGLESIVVAEGNSVYHSKNNCLIKTDSHTLIAGCKNSIIPDDGSVTSIGDGAFWFCERLESIEIPDSVTTIGESAFEDCSGLTSITIPDSVTSIGRWAFSGCSGLTSIEIPDSVTEIGGYAFKDCSGLTSITIPHSVTSIGENAFGYCSGLKTVYYKGTAEEWKNISIDWGNSHLTSATRYYFTEDTPTAEEWASYDYWWHYDPATSLPTPWGKDQ